MTSVVWIIELVLAYTLVSVAPAISPDILHDPLQCVAPGQNPVVNAVIPGTDLRTAKVYFRSDKYPKFYYVEMKGGADGLLSVLPKPSPETGSIVYYIEAVDVTFSNTIGSEYTVEVSESCPQPGDANERFEEPEIVVGSTEAGAAALPPGFEAAGIVGTITAAGLGSIVSGGSGIGTAVIVGGVAAGVGGVVATQVVQEESSPTPTDSAPVESIPDTSEPPHSPTAPPAPPSPPAPRPPDEPDAPDIPDTPDTPDTPEPPPPPPPPPTSTATACFTVSFPGNSCNLKVDASCSTSSAGSVTTYDWVFAASAALGGVTNASGASTNRSFPGCAGETVNVTLSIADSTGATDTLSRAVALPVSLTAALPSSPRVRATFTSFLDVRPLDGTCLGSIEIGEGTSHEVRNVAPQRHDYDARWGANVVGAVLLSDVGAEVLWTFDFGKNVRVTPGSLRPLRGTVVAVSERKITFRLSGRAGERVRLEYRLEP